MHELIVYKILNKIRNGRDHNTMSKLMGFSYNQYFKFEAGYKILRLEDFCNLCQTMTPFNLKYALEKSLSISLDSLDQVQIFSSIGEVWGSPPESVIKEYLNFSTSKWWRIQNGKSPIALFDLLKYIDVTTGKLNHFLENFLNTREITNLMNTSCDYEMAMEKLKEFPQITLITACLYTRDYQEAPVAEKESTLKSLCKIPSPLFENLIEIIIKYKICVEYDGKLEVHNFKPEFRGISDDRSKSFYRYSQDLINQKLEHSLDKKLDRMTYKIAPISEEAKHLIQQELRESYQRISQIIEDEPVSKKSDLMVFSQGMFFQN
jgi:hypothetical protein